MKKVIKSRDSDGASDQKQDPLERRRLQNRLSQRNHRRKIRDRIAKLQERVIANELRAAAALNGWDQPHSPTPLLSTRHAFHQENGSYHGVLNASMSMKEPWETFSSPFGVSMPSPYPSTELQPSPIVLEETLWPWDFSAWSGETQPLKSNFGELMGYGKNSSFAFQKEEPGLPEMLDPNGSPHSPQNFATPANQPLYYAVTENALPQILQVLSSTSPQSKIIVLVAPETVNQTMMDSPIHASSPLESNGQHDYSQQIGVGQGMMCPCQSHCMISTLTASMASSQ